MYDTLSRLTVLRQEAGRGPGNEAMLYVHVLHLLHRGLFLILGLNCLIVALDAVAEKGLSNRDSFTPEWKKCHC